jgi:hypothetical protein
MRSQIRGGEHPETLVYGFGGFLGLNYQGDARHSEGFFL